MFIRRFDTEESYIGILLNNDTLCKIIELATLGNRDYRKVIEVSIDILYKEAKLDISETIK